MLWLLQSDVGVVCLNRFRSNLCIIRLHPGCNLNLWFAGSDTQRARGSSMFPSHRCRQHTIFWNIPFRHRISDQAGQITSVEYTQFVECTGGRHVE